MRAGSGEPLLEQIGVPARSDRRRAAGGSQVGMSSAYIQLWLRAWGATVLGTYGTAEAGTRTPYVQYVGPWGQAALCARYVPNAGGWYG